MSIKKVAFLLPLVLVIFVLFSSPKTHGEVLFEDDFNQHTTAWITSGAGGHQVSGGTIANPGKGEPEGWTGYIDYSANNFLGIVLNEGINNSPCLKIGPEPGNSPFEQVGLVKYLGESGYNEIYIRFYVKIDADWRWGNGTGGSQGYWKWLRIWQNVTDEEVAGQTGNLSSEENRGHVIVELDDDDYQTFDPYFKFRTDDTDPNHDSVQSLTAGHNVSGWSYDWGTDRGFIENLMDTSIDGSGYWSSAPEWHCFEIYIKLTGTYGGSGGVIQIWFDGVLQDWPRHYSKGSSLPTGIYGNGINYIGLFDNGSGNQYWPGLRYVWVDNVVISTTYIGTLDEAPSPTVEAPTNLRIKDMPK